LGEISKGKKRDERFRGLIPVKVVFIGKAGGILSSPLT
jgi:hypothetical protein